MSALESSNGLGSKGVVADSTADGLPRTPPNGVAEGQGQGAVKNSGTRPTRSTSTDVSWSSKEYQSKPPSPRSRRLKHYDWLTTPPPDDLTPFQRFVVHDVDWKTSPLGPIDGWPTWLKRMVTLVMSDPTPAVIYVDNEEGITNAIVYNEAYPALIGNKHPALQGHDPRVGFAEIWPQFVDILARGRDDFETVVGAAQPLLLHRHDFFEETWFSWKFTPVIGPDGYVVASHATVVENTREILLDRRSNILQTIDQEITASKNVKEMWQNLQAALEHNCADVPFALIYSSDSIASQLPERERSPAPPPSKVFLESAVGKGAFAAAPKEVDLTEEAGFASIFIQAMNQGSPVHVHVNNLPQELVPTFRSRDHGEACEYGIICPVQSPSRRSAIGFIFIGQNPRRPYDEDYLDFMNRLTKQVSSTGNRLLLSEQLSKKTKEYKESEMRFSRFTSRAPLGLALFEVDGHLLYGNDFWHRMLQYIPGAKDVSDSGRPLWVDSIHPEDQPAVWDAWTTVLETRKPVRVQFRVTTPRTALDSGAPEGILTLLCQAFADMDEKGNVQSVMSCLTDVSELKDLEEQLRARTREVENKMEHVLEMKRQQENFIDMTSHEIRNPLSAVLHLAEEIFTNSGEILDMPQVRGIPKLQQESAKDMLKGMVEAAETITACVLHQKRIVDDILVLSRLDSELLTVTPVATQPKDLITSALKMFEAEVRTAKMPLDFIEDRSLHDLDVQWLMFDPNRVIQILVNLVGNAIKFTKTQEVRQITVSMSASLERPTDVPSDVDFVPLQSGSDYMGKGYSENGDGEVVYLSLGVSDTGQGLSGSEKKVLFQRFSQGSKRTHTKYGGSGLGLWISKQLTELHGGQIGISSRERQGSNFLFFIKTRRTSAPEEPSRRRSISHETNIASGEILRHAATKPVNELSPEERPLAVRSRSSDVRLNGGQPLSDVKEETFNVLVVEDNIVNQTIVAKQLRKLNCVVHVANHGQEALDFLQKTVFWTGEPPAGSEPQIPLSMVLMDLEMPVMDGLTAVKRIRKLQADGKLKDHIPVLAVTANARGEQLEEALKAGMDSSITKPYRVPEMMKRIEELAYRFT